MGLRHLSRHDRLEGHFVHEAASGVGDTQKSAWHLAHRIRKAIEDGNAPLFAGPADQMAIVVRRTVGRRLRYRELVADNGLPSGARG